MCGRFALFSLLQDILREFDIQESDLSSLLPRYNIAPTQPALVVTNRDGRFRLQEMRWGLIPSWAKDSSMGSRLINARAETLDRKPSFRNALHGRRCLVVADGFFEWRKTNGSRIPHFIRLRSERPFSMAGLWDSWSSPSGNRLDTFTIVTTSANEVVESIHDRMPAILPRTDRPAWLDGHQMDAKPLLALLGPYAGSEMMMYPVSRLVNSPANDGPENVRPSLN